MTLSLFSDKGLKGNSFEIKVHDNSSHEFSTTRTKNQNRAIGRIRGGNYISGEPIK